MILTILSMWLVALALLLWTGWGLAELLTPAALRPLRPLLAPFFGYAFTTLAAYYLLWLGLPLDGGRWIIGAAALAINGLAWLRRGRGAGGAAQWGEIGLAGGLGLIGGLVGVLPLLYHGLLAPIGNSWDVEFYLPLATYLREFAYADLGQAPANPLVLTIQADPTYARAIGFAYFQGIVDSLGGWESLRSFAPLLGFMRLLGAAAVFVFARHALGLGRAGAALAALLVALNEVMLWVQYAGFAMHASSMALVPLALALTVLALRELSWRSTAAAGLLLSGLAANYHPALLGYGALAAGAGLWHILRGPRRAAVLGHGLALLAGSGLATFLIQLRAARAFFGVYEQGAAPLGTPDFISARTLLGLTPLASAEAPSPPPWGAAVSAAWPAVIWLAYGLALAAGAWWLWRGNPGCPLGAGGERGLALSMLALAGIYALGLRYAVGYPYGHMKGLSFIAFVPLAVIAGGTELSAVRYELSEASGDPPPATVHRQPTASIRQLIAGLLLLVVGATAWDSFGLVRDGPALYGRDRLELLEATALVPPGATVLVSGVAGMRGPTVGLLAYGLRDSPLIGNTAAGYAVYDALEEGDSAEFAFLGAAEDPTAWGYEAKPIWSNSIAALYKAADRRTAFLAGQPAAYLPAQGRALSQPTALEVIRFAIGRYLTLDQPLDLAVGADSLRRSTAAPAEAPAERDLLISVAAFEPATLTVSGAISQTFALTPGVSIIRTATLATPGLVRISSDRPVVLRWIESYQPRLGTPEQPAAVLVGASVTPSAAGASIAVQTPPTNQPLRMALEIYEDSTAPRHYGWALLPLGPATLDLDLAGRRLSVNGADAPITWGERAAGRYFAALWIYQGETLLGRLPLFTFQDDGAAASAIAPLDTNALVAGLPEPEQPRDLALGPIATLAGTTFTPAAPGRTARLSLWWRAQGPTPPTLVTAQILGGDNHKWAQWDGLLGGDATPGTGWLAGQTIRQDIPLAIDPAAPPGIYRLLIAGYAPDGARLPLGGQESLTLEIAVPAR